MSVKRSTAKRAAENKPLRRPKTGHQGTDWARLRQMSDDEADRSAARDPDNEPASRSWLDAGHLVDPVRKRAISLRLDPEVIDWFRSTGPRYQSRMNAVLRAYVEHRQNGAMEPVQGATSRRPGRSRRGIGR